MSLFSLSIPSIILSGSLCAAHETGPLPKPAAEHATETIQQLDYLESINCQGRDHLFTGELNLAIENFTDVLNSLDPEVDANQNLIASALWNRMISYAYAGLFEQTQDDIQLIRDLFIDPYQCNCNKTQERPIKLISHSEYNSRRPVLIKYADPNERLTPSECRERVRGTQSALCTGQKMIS